VARADLVLTAGAEERTKIRANEGLAKLFKRSLKLRQVSAGGCNGCELELNATANVNFDLQRFGIEWVASPRHADALVLSGTLTRTMKDALRLAWDAMSEPRFVVAVGACAISGGLYEHHPIKLCMEPSGDCWARARLRIAEIDASLDWLGRVLTEPHIWRPVRATLPALPPSQLAIAVVEGWRGVVVHCLETGHDGALVHYKVQDPSLRNWMGLALAVRGNDISDFPICNKSFDLSYCGNDL
jgi:Ni,Fe-hydrogenase III small subunit